MKVGTEINEIGKKIEKNQWIKKLFSEKNNKTDRPLERIHILKKERKDTNHKYHKWIMEYNYRSSSIKKIIRKYYEQLYAHKFGNMNQWINSSKIMN